MTTRERCESAIRYRKNGANCAQSLLAAFADVMGITEAQAMAMGAGLGGGSSDAAAVLRALNAPVLILGCACPEMAGSKAKAAEITKEFQRRFTEQFRHLNCRELLAEKELQSTDTALELAAGDHCGLLIVSAAEILCGMIGEK